MTSMAQSLSALVRFGDDKLQKVPVFQPEPTGLLCDVYCLRPGQAQKVHAHAGSDKVVVGLEGRLVAVVGDEEVVVGPGQTVLFRAGVPHGVRNDSSANATAFVVTAPRP